MGKGFSSEISHGPQYTQRELDLLRGVLKPQTNDDWLFVQKNANAVLEEKPKSPGEFYGVNTKNMAEAFKKYNPTKGVKDASDTFSPDDKDNSSE